MTEPFSLRPFAALAAVLVTHAAFAQAPPAETNATLARETSDPTSDLWYLFTEADLTFANGKPFRQSNQWTLELQPSLPVTLTRSWRLLNYPDLLLSSQGTPAGTQITGVEGFSWLAAFSPASRPLGFAWGAGPYVVFPVETCSGFGPSQWQAGPGAVVAWRSESFVISALIKAGWTTGGWGDEAGSLQIQYNIQRFFGDGMQIGLGRPRAEYTWNRDGSGAWDVPVGVDVGRIFHFGPLPVKILLEYDFFVLNDSRWEPEHLFRITFIPVFPSPFKGPLLEW